MDCALSVDGITVLAGQNEAGKSAVLRALKAFDLPSGTPPETTNFQPEGFLEAVPIVSMFFLPDPEDVNRIGTSRSESPRVTGPNTKELLAKGFWVHRNLKTNLFEVDKEISNAVNKDYEEYQKQREILLSIGETDEDEDDKSMPLEIFASNLYLSWSSFIYFDAFEDILPNEILFSDLGKKDTPSIIEDFLHISEIDTDLLTDLSDEDKRIDNYLASSSSRLNELFFGFWNQRFEEGRPVIEVSHKRDSSGNSKLSFSITDKFKQYPNQRSKGFLWYLSFFLRLYSQSKSGYSGLILLDEPGAYLHAKAQRDILDFLSKEIVTKTPVIYTTHSPFLLPSDKIHRVRLVIKKKGKGTKVYDKLTHPDIRGDGFKDTLTPIVESVGISVLDSVSLAKPNSVLVEGITDYIYLCNYISALDPDFYSELNIYPGFGASSLLTLSSLFTGWGKPYTVVLDRDKEGEDVKSRFLKEMSLPENRIVEVNSGISIEDIMSKSLFEKCLSSMSFHGDTEYERPSVLIKKKKMDKVLIANAFAGLLAQDSSLLDSETVARAKKLIQDIKMACAV